MSDKLFRQTLQTTCHRYYTVKPAVVEIADSQAPASHPQGHLLLSGRFESDHIFTAEQILNLDFGQIARQARGFFVCILSEFLTPEHIFWMLVLNLHFHWHEVECLNIYPRIMGYMRMVGDRLAVRGVPTFMVEAKPGQRYAQLMRMGLGRAKGMVAFCTAEYGAYTGVGYDTYRELEYAHDNALFVFPIRLCEAWPPTPTDNERGNWQNKLVFRRGLVYIDDQQMKNAEGVADQIADSVAELGLF